MKSHHSSFFTRISIIPFCLLLSMLMIISISCNKQKDEEAPVIVFSSPQTNSEYDIYDTITVKATVTDNEKVEYISISLTDQENNLLFSQEAYYEEKTIVTAEMSLIIDNNQLESGTYYIRIIASDGVNIMDNFREIRINELYPEMKYPLIITADPSGKCSVRAFKNESWSLIQSFDDTIEHSDLSSAFSLLYISGPEGAGLKAIDLTDYKTKWQALNQQHVSGKWFTGIDFQYPYVFISTVDGNIRALDKAGTVMQLKICNSGTYAGFVQSAANKVYSATTLPFPETYYISAYYSGNSVPSVTTPIPEKPVALKYLSDNKILICTLKDEKSTLWIFNSVNSTISKLRTIDEELTDLTLISPEVVLLATRQHVYSYDIAANSLINIFTSETETHLSLAYNYIDQLIYIGEKNRIHLINFPESTVAGQITAPEQVTRIMLLFNK